MLFGVYPVKSHLPDLDPCLFLIIQQAVHNKLRLVKIRLHRPNVIRQTDKSEEVYKKYFEGKDWSGMDEEQMVMIGDTLHLCSYIPVTFDMIL